MTQERINKIFATDLGMQCLELYSTPDDHVWIRYSEALNHCRDKDFDISGIQTWYPDDDLNTEQHEL